MGKPGNQRSHPPLKKEPTGLINQPVIKAMRVNNIKEDHF